MQAAFTPLLFKSYSRRAVTSERLLRHDPDIAIHHGLAVALQKNGAGLRRFGFALTGFGRNAIVIVDGNAVVAYCDESVFQLATVGAVAA
jgi:hypothetical protein